MHLILPPPPQAGMYSTVLVVQAYIYMLVLFLIAGTVHRNLLQSSAHLQAGSGQERFGNPRVLGASGVVSSPHSCTGFSRCSGGCSKPMVNVWLVFLPKSVFHRC